MLTSKPVSIYALLALFWTLLFAPKLPLAAPLQRAAHTAVSTQGAATTEAAKLILTQGGNIIDAAVAASFAISVERPHSTGIGGGGFLLFRDGKTGKVFAVDFRERAPLAARTRMYLDAQGNVIPNRSIDGILAVGVPGLVAGLLEVHKKWGKLPLSTVMAPAIHLADQGLIVYPALAEALDDRKDVLAQFAATRAIFLKSDGKPYVTGDRLVQKDLAATLKVIAKSGPGAFYRGRIAQAILEESRKSGGILSKKDLESYSVKWRKPIRGTFKGHEIISMPPPSSGGTHVIQILNILEQDDLAKLGPLSPAAIHLTASAMQMAFADRSKFMGDPDFVKVPTDALISKKYARALRATIDPARAKRSTEVKPGYESSDTTHFSIMDSDGNMVASTQTINGWMGSGVVVPGTGILLNNEMDDFSAKPGASNLFGAVGGSANSILPRKTPLSSMSPTLILKEGRPLLALGAPGGTRIISCVVQTILNFLEFRMPLAEAIALPRFHHQWSPDELSMELRTGAALPSLETRQALEKMGYVLNTGPDAVHCHVMAVARVGEQLVGASDPRDSGTAAAL